jgi:hypothetical protein
MNLESKYKSNLILCLKPLLTTVELIDVEHRVNFSNLTMTILEMTLNGLRQVEMQETVIGAIQLSLVLIKASDATQFAIIYEKLSICHREVVELQIANFKADMLTLRSQQNMAGLQTDNPLAIRLQNQLQVMY